MALSLAVEHSNGPSGPFFYAILRVGRCNRQEVVQLPGDPAAWDEMAACMNIKRHLPLGTVLPCGAMKNQGLCRAPIAARSSRFVTA